MKTILETIQPHHIHKARLFFAWATITASIGGLGVVALVIR